jgi:RNA-binding protein 23/39
MPTSSGFGLKNYVTTINWTTKNNKNFKNNNKPRAKSKVKIQTTVNEKLNLQKIEESDDDYTKMVQRRIVRETKRKNDEENDQNNTDDNDDAYVVIDRNPIQVSRYGDANYVKSNLKMKPNIEYVMTTSKNKNSKNIYKNGASKIKQINRKDNISKSVTKANPKKTQGDVLEIKPRMKDFVEVVEDIEKRSIISTNSLCESLQESELNLKKRKELKMNDLSNEDLITFIESSFLSDENSEKKLISKKHSIKLNDRRTWANSSDDNNKKDKLKQDDHKLNSRDSSSSEPPFEKHKIQSKNEEKKSKITKKKNNENKIRKYKNTSDISFSSETSIVEDDRLNIDQKGDLNFYIKAEKKQEKNNNDEIDEDQLRELITKIMKNKKPSNNNKKSDGKVKRTIKTEDTGGDKGNFKNIYSHFKKLKLTFEI